MQPHTVGLLAAAGSSAVYFSGTALFKVAGRRMGRLRGNRAIFTGLQLATSPLWWAGVVVMAGGVGLQYAAFTRLALADAVPAFLAGLALLVILAYACFGERLTGVEAANLAVMAAAGVVIARSMAGAGRSGITVRTGPGFLVVAGLCLTLPVILFWLGDLRPSGVHARRLTGVAYGVSAGMLIGTAEFAVDMMARNGPGVIPLVLFPAAVGLGVAQMLIGLQRCRMVTFVTVATVVAKTWLLTLAALYSPGGALWRHASPGWLAAGVGLAFFGFTIVPRFERRQIRAAGGTHRRPEPGHLPD